MVVRPSRRATPIPYSDLLESVVCGGTMTTSVVNPFAFTEINRIRGMVRSRPAVDAAALARVRRDLLGPVDHQETRKFVMRELAAQQALSSERWGFDFDREQPIRDGPGSSKYLWVKVTEEDSVPQAYSHEYTLTETIIRDPAEDADVSAAAPTPPASPLEAASSTCPTASSPEEIHRSSKPAAKTVRRSSARRSMKRRRPDESHQKKMTDFLRIRKSSSSLSVKAPKIRRLSDPAIAMSLPSAQRTGTS